MKFFQVMAVSLCLFGVGCKAVCPVLNVIADASKEACPVVVEYVDKDDKKQQVVLPREAVLSAVHQQAVRSGKPAPKGAVVSASSACPPTP